MANIIKIKRSTTTATPSALSEGELAYSENSGNLFIGASGSNIHTIGGSAKDAFGTITVSGQSDVVADTGGDTLTLVAGSNVTITTDAGTDTVTIAATGNTGVTSVAAGDGMDFTSITDTGSVTLGTPSALTASTTDAVTATSHTHSITGFLPSTYLDTAIDLGGGAASDTKIASQLAVKTYADNLIDAANGLVYQGAIDCSANPNYPAANAGHMYLVSVAGKIGGGSGEDVEVGDMAVCLVDNSIAGAEATSAGVVATFTTDTPADSFDSVTNGTYNVVLDGNTSGVGIDFDITFATNDITGVTINYGGQGFVGTETITVGFADLVGSGATSGSTTFTVSTLEADTVGDNWNVVQSNLNGAVIGPASATDSNVVMFDGTSGTLIKDSGLTISGSNTGDVTLANTNYLSITNQEITGNTIGAAYGGTGQAGGYAIGDILYASGASALSKLAGVATGNVLISGGVTTAPSYGKVGLTTHVSGTLPVANGGTNITSYAVGDLVYASATTTLSKLADIATGNVLISGGVGVAPSYGKVGLTTHVSGTLPVANGGTNFSSYTVGDIVYASGATALSKLAGVATGNVLISGGVATAPAYGKVGLTTHVSGTLAVGNGGTGATTFTANGILYGNTTSAVQVTAAGTYDSTAGFESGQLLSVNASNVPTWTNTIDGGTFA